MLVEQKPNPAKNGILKGMVSKWGLIRDYLPSKIPPKLTDTLFPGAVKEELQLAPVEERVEKWLRRLNEDYRVTGMYFDRDGQLEKQQHVERIRDAYIGVAREHFNQETLTELRTEGIEYQRFDIKVLEERRNISHEEIRIMQLQDELFAREQIPMTEILALDDKRKELWQKDDVLGPKTYTMEQKTDTLFAPKEELVGRLNDHEKEALAHVLNLSGLDYSITGKGVLSDQEPLSLKTGFIKSIGKMKIIGELIPTTTMKIISNGNRTL